MFLRPTPAEERWLALADRYPALHDAAAARAGGWTTASLLSRVLMFVLGLFAASLIAGSLFWLPGRGVVAGIAMVAGGEWLIRQRRLFAGGIEEALVGCGFIAIAAELLASVPSVSTRTGALALGLAVLAAGLRVGNAAFVALAAVGLSVVASGGTLIGGELHALGAIGFCIVVASGALVLGARRWKRPSHDRMLDGLVIVMPAAAQAWAIAEWPNALKLQTLGADPGALVPALLALAFAIALGAIGLRRRAHAPLIGALVQVAFFAYAVRELTGLTLHARLVLWGAVLLAAGIALERGLRRPRGGITSAAVGRRRGIEDLAQVYGTAHLGPAAAVPAPGGVEGAGGSFGGGGASGRY